MLVAPCYYCCNAARCRWLLVLLLLLLLPLLATACCCCCFSTLFQFHLHKPSETEQKPTVVEAKLVSFGALLLLLLLLLLSSRCCFHRCYCCFLPCCAAAAAAPAAAAAEQSALGNLSIADRPLNQAEQAAHLCFCLGQASVNIV